jgi:CO dehydrogenase/acetyl-CoA synthase alpha subunit
MSGTSAHRVAAELRTMEIHVAVALFGECHTDGMARTRLSTTVDSALLTQARGIRSNVTDAALIDEALAALLARHRAAEVDASYAAYDEHPLDEPDEWGDLASFRRAAAAS